MRPGCLATPNVAATTLGTEAASAIAARSTNQTPSTNSLATRQPITIAARVFPTPPDPVNVTIHGELAPANLPMWFCEITHRFGSKPGQDCRSSIRPTSTGDRPTARQDSDAEHVHRFDKPFEVHAPEIDQADWARLVQHVCATSADTTV